MNYPGASGFIQGLNLAIWLNLGYKMKEAISASPPANFICPPLASG